MMIHPGYYEPDLGKKFTPTMLPIQKSPGNMSPTCLVLFADFLFACASIEGGISAGINVLTSGGITLNFAYQLMSHSNQVSNLITTLYTPGIRELLWKQESSENREYVTHAVKRFKWVTRGVILKHFNKAVANHGPDFEPSKGAMQRSILVLALAPGGLIDAGSGKLKEEDKVDIRNISVPDDAVTQALVGDCPLQQCKFEATGSLKNLGTFRERALFFYVHFIAAMYERFKSLFNLPVMVTYDSERDGTTNPGREPTGKLFNSNGKQVELTFNQSGNLKMKGPVDDTSQQASCFIPEIFWPENVFDKLTQPDGAITNGVGFTAPVEVIKKFIKVTDMRSGDTICGVPSSGQKRKTAASRTTTDETMDTDEYRSMVTKKMKEFQDNVDDPTLSAAAKAIAKNALDAIAAISKMNADESATPERGMPTMEDSIPRISATTAPNSAETSPHAGTNANAGVEAEPGEEESRGRQEDPNEVTTALDQEAAADQEQEDESSEEAVSAAKQSKKTTGRRMRSSTRSNTKKSRK